jgi:integrase
LDCAICARKARPTWWRRGIDIPRVQHLLGHASVRTTEIYIKGLLPTTVRPNETPIIASVK